MNWKTLTFANHMLVVIVNLALISKSIYMLLGYGGSLDSLSTLGYAGGLILFGTILPLYVYGNFIKKQK